MRKILLCLALMSSTACGADASFEAVPSNLSTSQGERWTANDDPALFGEVLERNIGRLPLHGRAARTPWVGSYWPHYLDSINFRWQGPNTYSAVSKYQMAFGGSNLENIVSASHGIDAMVAPTCYGTGSCGGGRMCATRPGQSAGRCVPLWWGLCQGWASASILEPEPRRPVIADNGVRFEVADIKALLTLMYNDPELRMVSLRCTSDVRSLPRDASGRPVQSECRDSNPGTFHLLLANYLGMRGQSFVEDRSMDADVWNQPLVSYDVLKMHAVDLPTAHRVLGVASTGYRYNPQAAKLVYVMTDVAFIREASPDTDGYLGNDVQKYTYVDRYEYILELDSAGSIIGGEWAGPSKHNHPDFLWLPTSAGSKPLARGAMDPSNILRLARAAQ